MYAMKWHSIVNYNCSWYLYVVELSEYVCGLPGLRINIKMEKEQLHYAWYWIWAQILIEVRYLSSYLNILSLLRLTQDLVHRRCKINIPSLHTQMISCSALYHDLGKQSLAGPVYKIVFRCFFLFICFFFLWWKIRFQENILKLPC